MKNTIDDLIINVQNQLGTIKHDANSPSNFYLKTPDSKEHILLGYCQIDRKIRLDEKGKDGEKSLKLIDLTEFKTGKDIQDFREKVEVGQIQLMYIPQESSATYARATKEIVPRATKEPIYFMQQLREKNIAITDIVNRTYK